MTTRSEAAKKAWANPEIRARRLKALTAQNQRPEVRQKISERKKDWWDDPEKGTARKAAVAQQMKDRWTDPKMRKTMVENHTRGNTRARAKVKGVCVYCGKDGTEYDHDVPPTRGGSNEPENLVVACVKCNCSKGRLTGDEYRQLLTLQKAR